MISNIPAALQKPISTYFEKSLSGQISSRYQFPARNGGILGEKIQNIIHNIEECIFVKYNKKNKDIIGICRSDSIKKIIMSLISNFDVMSLYFGKSSITISADESLDKESIDLNLVVWGPIKEEMDFIAEQLSGLIY